MDSVERFARHQPEWAVGSLGLAVVAELLERADLEGWSQAIAASRVELSDMFRRGGWQVAAADAPWVLVQAPGLRERLAREGVLVRDCGSFGIPDHVRVAVPDSAGMDRLEQALSRSRNGTDP